MGQVFYYMRNDRFERLLLPEPEAEVLPGVAWGDCGALFTPAYWAIQAFMEDLRRAKLEQIQHASNLTEAVCMCLLGGYGISWEMNEAAFLHLREGGTFIGEPRSAAEIEFLLRQPLWVEGSSRRYRFPAVKAKYLAGALSFLNTHPEAPKDDVKFRDWLLQIPGVGLKTASWITRDWLGSNRIAIIDIHLQRAGLLMGLFSEADRISRDYHRMESRFVAFCKAAKVPAWAMDQLIWSDMRKNTMAIPMLEKRRQAARVQAQDRPPSEMTQAGA